MKNKKEYIDHNQIDYTIEENVFESRQQTNNEIWYQGMTTKQHQYIGRASRNLLYALRWFERATADELPEDELKRLQRAQEYVKKALDKL